MAWGLQFWLTMQNLALTPILAFLIFMPGLAQAKCETWLSAKAYSQKLSRIFTIVSIAMLPVHDTVIPEPPPLTIEQLQKIEASPIEVEAQTQYKKLERYLNRELAKAPELQDQEKIDHLRRGMQELKNLFPRAFIQFTTSK